MFNIFGKIGDFFKDMLIGSIQANLEAMFTDINEKVSTIATQVGQTPQSFNSEVFSFIKSINDTVILPIAGLIITAILCIELIQTVMNKNNMSDGDTFEIFKYIFKMAIAVYLVSHAFDFAAAAFDLAQNMVSKASGIIITSNNISADEFATMIEALKEHSIGSLIGLLMETFLVKFIIQGISVLIFIVLYGRMFEIYLYMSISAIPFATMGNKDWNSIGQNFIKGLFALALQGLFLMICVGVYATLVKTINVTEIHKSMFEILGVTVLLGLMMLKSGSLAKSVMNAH